MQNCKFLCHSGIPFSEPPLSTNSQSMKSKCRTGHTVGLQQMLAPASVCLTDPSLLSIFSTKSAALLCYEFSFSSLYKAVNQNRSKSTAFLSWLLLLSNFPLSFGTPLCRSLADQCSHHVLI